MRKGVVFIQLVIICLCFGWLYTQIDWKAVYTSLEELSVASVGLLGLIFVQRFTPWVLLSCRLQQVFAKEISYKESFNAATFCVGVNAVAPARLGELVKIIWLKSVSSFSYAHVVGGCVVERMLDVTILLFLSLCFAMTHLHAALVLSLSVILIVSWIVLFMFVKNTKYLQLKRKLHNPPFWQDYLLALQEALANITTWSTLTRLWAWTVGIWVLNYVHIALIVNYLVKLDLNFQELGLLTVAVFFSSALLLMPGGIGVMETTIIATLQLMHVSLHEAAIVAIFIRLFHLLPSILVGVFALLQSGIQSATMLESLRSHRLTFASK